jgi:hypothetical protein
MAKQFKLVQVVGKKIDPNAKYMFMLDGRTPYSQVEHFVSEMARLLGKDNFAVTLTNSDPKRAMSIMEVVSDVPEKTVTVREQYVYSQMPESIARSLNRRPEDCVDCEEKQRQRQAPTTYEAVPPDVQPNAELSENEA